MGKGAKTQVTEYYMSQHFGVSTVVDALKRILIKEKVAWSGYLTAQTSWRIKEEDLFGGNKKEGGAVGTIYWLPGDEDQVLPDELAQRLGRADGADAPGYRGLSSLFFTGRPDDNDGALGFNWSANNPYLPGVWATVERAPIGLDPAYALIPRPGSDFFPFTSVAGLAGFNVEALTPSGRTAIVPYGSGGVDYLQIWDMASRTLVSEVVTSGPTGYDIGVDSETSFYGVFGGPELRHYDVDGSYSTVTTDFDTPFIGGVQYVAGRVLVLPGSDADLSFNFFDGSAVANVTVGFNATCFFENLDGGDAWAVGPVRSGGDVGIGHLLPDGTVEVFFVHTGADSDCGALGAGNGQIFIAQQNAGGFIVDTTTQAIVHTSVSTNVSAAGNELREDFNVARNSGSDRVWIGFAQWSATTGELVRTVTPADWKSASAARTVYDRAANSLLSYEAFTSTSATWRDLDRGERDANPAHMIFEALTNTDWGMGSPTSLIDVDGFEAVGIVLYDEPLGLSMLWTRQAAIQDFIQEILDHIQGVLFVDPQTGLLTLKLIRGDYDVADLPTISPSTAQLTTFGRKLWGEIVNEINVTWTSPDTELEETVTAQDLGSIATQGGIVSDSRNYYGVRYAALGQRLGARDLRSAGAPLATCEAEVDRSFWYLRPGSVLLVDWPEHGLDGLVMRVTSIDYGKPGDPSIKLGLIEDVFGLDAGDYVDPPSSAWEDTSSPPTALDEQAALTLPYFFATNSLADFETAAYPEVVAGALGATTNSDVFAIELWAEVTLTGGGTEWQQLATLNVVGRAELAAGIAAEATSTGVTFTSFVGLTSPTSGGFAILPGADEESSEAALITATGSTYSLSRGVLDTVPKAWASGSPVWFVTSSNVIEDPTLRSAGETVRYRLLPRTSQGLLSLAAAPVLSYTLTERPYLPSRPANVTIDSVQFNTAATSVDMIGETVVPVTWANRNRLTEDTTVLSWTAGNVTPETGQTTTITVLKADETTVLATHTGLSGTSYNVPVSDFGSEVVGLIKVSASRTDSDGTFDSLQGHGIWIRVAAAGGAEGSSGSGTASFAGAAVKDGALSGSGTGAASPTGSAFAGNAFSSSSSGAMSLAGSAIEGGALSGAGTGTTSLVGSAGATTDIYYDLVKLLMGLEGTNGSTTFTDESDSPVTFSVAAGSPAITTAQSKFGSSSLGLNGTSNISTPGGTVKWQPTREDWTLEFFARHTNTDAGTDREYLRWGDHGGGVISQSISHLAGGSGTWDFNLRGASVGSLEISTGGFGVTAGQWMHICHERAGSVLRGYVDGVMVAKATGVTDAILDNASHPFIIGSTLDGQIDELRQTIGVARYNNDSGFTAPAAAFPRAVGAPTTPTVVQDARAITNATANVVFGAAPTSGNLLIAFCTHWNNANTVNSGAGWVALLQTNGAVNDGWAIAYKVCGGSESTTQTPFTFGASGNSLAVIEVHGALPPSPANPYLARDQENTTASLSEAALAAPMGNCLQVGAFFAISTGGLTPTLSGVTQVGQTSGNGTATQSVPRCVTTFKATPAKGAVTTAQATYSGSLIQWVAMLTLLPSS